MPVTRENMASHFHWLFAQEGWTRESGKLGQWRKQRGPLGIGRKNTEEDI